MTKLKKKVDRPKATIKNSDTNKNKLKKKYEMAIAPPSGGKL